MIRQGQVGPIPDGSLIEQFNYLAMSCKWIRIRRFLRFCSSLRQNRPDCFPFGINIYYHGEVKGEQNAKEKINAHGVSVSIGRNSKSNRKRYIGLVDEVLSGTNH